MRVEAGFRDYVVGQSVRTMKLPVLTGEGKKTVCCMRHNSRYEGAVLNNCLFTVGELAKMTGISKQAIRYYDRIGLLKPGKIGENAYRYYEPMHVLYLNSIMRLTQLGCTLEETQRYISGRDLGAVRGMLKIRRDLTARRIEELARAMAALDEQICQIDAGTAAYGCDGVHMRRMPERYFVYKVSCDPPDLKHGITQICMLVRELNEKGLLYVGSPVFEIMSGRLKTGYFLSAQTDGFCTDTVPAGEYACICHKGSYENMQDSLDRLQAHLDKNGLTAQSGMFQHFLIDYALTQNEDELLTELQVKVGK